MYTVELKFNQPWQIRKKFAEPGKWLTVATQQEKVEAEKDISYITMNIEDYAHSMTDFQVDYRIVSNGKIVWSKQEIYNETK